ncbi:MAG: PQQ-dependent sugar dehydrogenase, partial [Planctomycetota bacterium]
MFASTTLALALAPASSFIPSPAPPQVAIALERVIDSGAGLIQPVDLQARPGDSRLYVAERGGLVRIVSSGAVSPVPFADLTDDVAVDGDTGLRALAFPPDHASTGHVFLWFDTAPPGVNSESSPPDRVDGVLIRMTVATDDPDRVDPTTREEILRVPQDGISHGGGRIAFDGGGRLLLGIGDGTPGGDPMCRAQDRSNLQGTILRIDVSGDLPYSVPSDNPFVGMPDVRPEILHFGLRHPWKWCVDPATDDLWIADVGEVHREEVNFVPAGAAGLNFGWPAYEGTQCFTGEGCVDRPGCEEPGLTAPVFEYD